MKVTMFRSEDDNDVTKVQVYVYELKLVLKKLYNIFEVLRYFDTYPFMSKFCHQCFDIQTCNFYFFF